MSAWMMTNGRGRFPSAGAVEARTALSLSCSIDLDQRRRMGRAIQSTGSPKGLPASA